VATYTGFWMLKGKGSLSRLPPVLRNPGSVRTIMIGLIGLSLLVLIIFLRDRGGINEHLTSLGGGRFKELSQYGAVIVSINLGALALYVWIATNPSEIKSPIFLAALAAVAAAMFLSNGTRGGALEILMIVGLIWALRRQQIPWKIALVLIPFMFVSIGLLGAVRTSSWSGSTAGKAFENANWSESFALAEKEVQVRNATSAPVPVVARGFDLTGGLLLGRSYVGAVAAFIPRTIWPDKPRGVGSLYAQLFLGASKSGTTIPVSPEAEMYWNFGIPGVILLSIVYGAMLRGAYNLYWRHYPSGFATILYVLFITKFQFSSDKLIILEQRIVLLTLCYTVLVMLVPKDRPWASRHPGQPLGAARSAT
jgi:oligosaccharide repeat unit polymerase